MATKEKKCTCVLPDYRGRWDIERAALETHARERRLLRLLAQGKGFLSVSGTIEVYEPGPGRYFTFKCDAYGCPIVSDELNEALVEALGEKEKGD